MIHKNLYFYKFILTRVIDGDTVVGNIDLGFDLFLNKQNIRLLGIDTPEIRGPEKAMGFIAKDYLYNLLQDKELILHSLNRDSFGRVLAELFIYDNTRWLSVNVILLNEGIALPYI